MGRMPNAKRKRAPTLTVQKKPHGKPDAQCIAHCTNGRRCNGRIEPQKRGQPMPYCRKHLRAGDGALKVYQHPKGYGKILVARFNLAKGYRMVYHGHRKTTGTHHDDELDPDEDRTLWFYPDGQGRVNGYIDPTGCPGSVLQFAANCGPKEVVNLRQSNRAFGARDGETTGAWSTPRPWRCLRVRSWCTTTAPPGGRTGPSSSAAMLARIAFLHRSARQSERGGKSHKPLAGGKEAEKGGVYE
ncbi:unnamed protein product, partial [Effrenium voratum]